MNPTHFLLVVSIVFLGLFSYTMWYFASPSSFVMDSHKKILNKNGHTSVGDVCDATNQYEVARLMGGLLRKTVWDLTDEEKSKVDEELVQQGLQMCSLKKELFCLNTTSVGLGICKACRDLDQEESMGNDLKELNQGLCEHAKKIGTKSRECVGVGWWFFGSLAVLAFFTSLG